MLAFGIALASSIMFARVLVLSAAPADNEGLEDFLQREFFGMPLAKRGP
jgi:hypothetical protein